MFTEVQRSRSPKTAALRQSSVTAAAAGGSIGSVYPPLLPADRGPFAADLRTRLLVDARSAFSSVRRTSRDQPEVGARDVTTSTAAAKPRIWCIADVATSPDSGPPRPSLPGPAITSLPTSRAVQPLRSLEVRTDR